MVKKADKDTANAAIIISNICQELGNIARERVIQAVKDGESSPGTELLLLADVAKTFYVNNVTEIAYCGRMSDEDTRQLIRDTHKSLMPGLMSRYNQNCNIREARLKSFKKTMKTKESLLPKRVK